MNRHPTGFRQAPGIVFILIHRENMIFITDQSHFYPIVAGGGTLANVHIVSGQANCHGLDHHAITVDHEAMISRKLGLFRLLRLRRLRRFIALSRGILRVNFPLCIKVGVAGGTVQNLHLHAAFRLCEPTLEDVMLPCCGNGLGRQLGIIALHVICTVAGYILSAARIVDHITYLIRHGAGIVGVEIHLCFQYAASHMAQAAVTAGHGINGECIQNVVIIHGFHSQRLDQR